MTRSKEDFADYRKRASTDYLKLAEEREEEARVIGQDETPGSQFGMVSSLCELSASACRHAADKCSKAQSEGEVDAIKIATLMLNEKLNTAIHVTYANTSQWPQ